MPPISTSEHVELFLGPLNPLETVVTFTERLFETADRDSTTASVVERALDFRDTRRAALERRLAEGSRSVDEAEMRLIAATYLRIEQRLAMTGFNTTAALRDISKGGVPPFERFLKRIDEDFVVELSAEVDKRSLIDPQFRAELMKGREDVARASSRVRHISRSSQVLQRHNPANPTGASLTGAEVALVLGVLNILFLTKSLKD